MKDMPRSSRLLIVFGFMVWRDEQNYFMYAILGAVAGFIVGVISSGYPY